MPVRIIIFVVGFIIGFIGMSLILHFTGNTPDAIYLNTMANGSRLIKQNLKAHMSPIMKTLK